MGGDTTSRGVTGRKTWEPLRGLGKTGKHFAEGFSGDGSFICRANVQLLFTELTQTSSRELLGPRKKPVVGDGKGELFIGIVIWPSKQKTTISSCKSVPRLLCRRLWKHKTLISLVGCAKIPSTTQSIGRVYQPAGGRRGCFHQFLFPTDPHLPKVPFAGDP